MRALTVGEIREAIKKMKNLSQPSEDGVYTMLAYRYVKWRGNVYEFDGTHLRWTPYKEPPYVEFKMVDDAWDLSRLIKK